MIQEWPECDHKQTATCCWLNKQTNKQKVWEGSMYTFKVVGKIFITEESV